MAFKSLEAVEKWLSFNRTFGRGVFGNLNFAVKMNSLADFTIKGVAFDPSEVARIASKVTTQSLLLAAQISGVPVTGLTVTQQDAGSALATQSAELEKVLAANQCFVGPTLLRQEAIAAILGRTAQEKSNLQAGNAEADAAIKATAA